MSGLSIFAIASTWLMLLAGGWLGWQLLRQNGRILLRLDELEQRLDEMEFGEPDSELATESQGRVRHSVRAEAERQENGAQGTDAPYPDDRANRFGNRSLARSRIKRDGLKAGTSAPGFRLPRLDGGELSLEELRGRRVLLVFSDPHCGPCNALAPQLEKFHRQQTGLKIGRDTPCAPRSDDRSPDGAHGVMRPTSDPAPTAVVMISRGEPKENRAKAREHGLTFPIVLQQQWEISRRYAMFATPVAYLIDEQGIIASDVAVGVEPIVALLSAKNEEVVTLSP